MKAIKRTVAGLLATLMFASCFSFNFAFGADNYTDEEAVAVSKVNAANIMTGTDNGFEPSKTLTRAEAAAIVVRMKNVPASQVEGAKGNTIFTDVPASSWAAGYINAANSMGIISGVGNGLFLPEREVSVVEFAAMAIRALGAGKLVDSIGTWPTNYVNFATEEKLLEGVLKAYTAPATRMDVAYMVVNTIEADTWEKTNVTNTSEVTYTKQTGKTMLKDVLKITEDLNEVVSSVDTKERTVTFEDGTCAGFKVAEGVELATLKVGMEVDVWSKGKTEEIIRIAPAEVTSQAKVSFNGIKKVDLTTGKEKITLKVDGVEKKYSFDPANVLVSLNTLVQPEKLDNYVADLTGTGSTLFLVDNTADDDDTNDNLYDKDDEDVAVFAHDSFFGTALLDGNKITTLFVEQYTNRAVVKEVKNDNIYFESNSKVKSSIPETKFEMDDENIEYVVTKNGKEIDITDIEKGDAIYYYKDGDRYVIVVNNKSVTGTAKQVSEDKYVKVDGTKYELAIDSVDISAGSEVKLYLNGGNKVTMYQIIDGAVDSTVALVKSLREASKTYADQANGNLEIVLVQLDGTELDTKVVDLEESFEKLQTTYYNNANTGTNGTGYDAGEEYFANEDALKAAIYSPYAVSHTYVDGDDAGTVCDICGVDGSVLNPQQDNDDACAANNSIVGTMIRYTLKGGKVVIREFYDEDRDAIASSFDKAEIEEFGPENYVEENRRLGSKYRLNDDTTIYVVKSVSGNDKKHSVKFEKVDLEDLGSTNGLNGYVLGKDKNTNLVDAVLFAAEPSRATDKNYAVVLDVCSYKGSDEEDEDYSEELTLLLNNGDVVEVIVPDDLDIEFTANDIIEAFIDGDKLEDATKLTSDLTYETGTDTDKYAQKTVNVVSFNGDGTVRVLVSAGTAGDVKPDIAENCMYVMLEDDGELVKGSEGKVPTVSDNEAYNDSNKNAVEAYFVYNSETKTQEIIALVYKEK